MTGRVLLVDDNERWRRVVCDVLEKHPRWEVVAEGSNGLEAIQKAAAVKPDLILLDIELPIHSGIAAAREILAADPQSRILFVSGYRSAAIVGVALETGAGGYLLKSDAHQLVVAMDAVAGGHRFVSDSLRLRRVNESPLAPRCLLCRSWLFAAKFAADDADVPNAPDYVCPSCGTSYAVRGHPPALSIVRPLMPRPDDEDDD